MIASNDYHPTYFSFNGWPLKIYNNLHETEGEHLFDMHMHPEIGIVTEGEMWREDQGRSILLKRGDVWLSGMWEPHGYVIHSAPCRVMVILIDPFYFAKTDEPYMNWMNIFAIRSKGLLTSMPEYIRQQNLQMIEVLNQLSATPETLYYMEVKMHICNMLLRLFRMLQISPAEVDMPAHHILSALKPALDAVFDNKSFIAAEAAAALCHMSRNTFAKHFVAVMGVPFAVFALRHRLCAAAQMLAVSDIPVETVAQEWGFTDISHFSLHFRKHYGVSPGAYRKRT